MMNNKKFELFDFEKYFIHMRGERLTKIEQVQGDVAYISSTKENNGIDNYITFPEIMTLHENKMTLSNSGSIGYLFYHPYKFVASDHVTVIWIRDDSINLNENIAMFLKPIFESIKYKYNFGREISNSRLIKEKILLPINEDNGEPDWEFMNDYIKNLRLEIEFKNISSQNNERLEFEVSDWEDVPLIHYFDMFAGKYYPQNSFNPGEVPLISASSNNNGIMEMTDLEPVFKGNSLTIGKVGMPVFYQEIDYCATSDVTVLIPKFTLNKYIALFLITIISQEDYKWSYGRQIRLNDSKRLICKLPISKDLDNNKQYTIDKKTKEKIYIPDWNYMESIIKNINYGDKINR